MQSHGCLTTHLSSRVKYPLAFLISAHPFFHISDILIVCSYILLWFLNSRSFRSLEDHPKVPVFRAGREKKTTQVKMLTTAVSQMAKAMTGSPQAMLSSVNPSPPSGNVPARVGVSPGKIANLRSTYLHQMRDLHSLLESGCLTEAEFKEQKAVILDQLNKLGRT